MRPAILVIAAALVGAAGVGLFTVNREHEYTKALEAERSRSTAALDETRSEIRSLAARLEALTAAKAAPTEPERMAALKPRRVAVTRRPVAVVRRDDPRWKQFESRLTEQQKELADTRDAVAKTRDDLQGALNSTRDDLNSSIAKNHAELVALQKRGERNYYEFHLRKSKEFQAVGPVSLALRKADTKHKNYNVAMLVSDYRLDKKKVNLYEPIWINLADRPQPVELVVNQISKDEVSGYLSEPKYKRSELADNSPEQPKPQQQLLTR